MKLTYPGCTMKLTYHGMENTEQKTSLIHMYEYMSYHQLPCDGRTLTPTQKYEAGLQEKLGTSPCQLVFSSG